MIFQDNEPPTAIRGDHEKIEAENDDTDDSADDEEAEALLKNLQNLALPSSR